MVPLLTNNKNACLCSGGNMAACGNWQVPLFILLYASNSVLMVTGSVVPSVDAIGELDDVLLMWRICVLEIAIALRHITKTVVTRPNKNVRFSFCEFKKLCID